MKSNFDLKSGLLGLLAGILITFTIGAAAKSSGPVGRFQITGINSHALIIDTATGQVWRGFFTSGGGNTDGDFLQPKI
ncbi:MAG TPA: hypothetical protein VF773_18435 [Verrucomicrobiae bacterium]